METFKYWIRIASLCFMYIALSSLPSWSSAWIDLFDDDTPSISQSMNDEISFLSQSWVNLMANSTQAFTDFTKKNATPILSVGFIACTGVALYCLKSMSSETEKHFLFGTKA